MKKRSGVVAEATISKPKWATKAWYLLTGSVGVLVIGWFWMGSANRAVPRKVEAEPALAKQLVTVPYKEERDRIALQLVRAATKIALRTGDSRALAHAQELQDAAFLLPLNQDGFVYGGNSATSRLAIMPILKKDVTRLPSLQQQYADLSGSAVAAASYKTIVITDASLQAVSEDLLGLIVQHEMVHIEQFRRDESRGQLNDEAEAYLFEISLIEKMGGAKWGSLVKKEARRLQKHLTITGGAIRVDNKYVSMRTGAYDRELVPIFGSSSRTLREISIRSFLLRLAIYYEAYCQLVGQGKAFGYFAGFIGTHQRYK